MHFSFGQKQQNENSRYVVDSSCAWPGNFRAASTTSEQERLNLFGLFQKKRLFEHVGILLSCEGTCEKEYRCKKNKKRRSMIKIENDKIYMGGARFIRSIHSEAHELEYV